MKTLLLILVTTYLLVGLAHGQEPAVKQTLRAFEEQDSVIPVYSEPEQHAAVTWALALAQDPTGDEVTRQAAYARLGRWTRSLKSPDERRRAVLALCAALRARPSASRARFRSAVLDGLMEAAWPLEPGAAEAAREALAVTAADRSLLGRERRQVEALAARFGVAVAAR